MSGLVDLPVESPAGPPVAPQSAFQAPPLVEPGPARPEPLDYATRGGPQVPSYDGPSFSNNPNPASRQSTEQPFRVRDFSPEGRRAAQRDAEPAQAWSPPEGAAAQLPAALDYHTQAGAPVVPAPVVPAPLIPAPVAPTTEAPASAADPVADQPADRAQPLDDSGPVEQTLTRRELRALRAQEEADLVTSGQVPLTAPGDAAAPVSTPAQAPQSQAAPPLVEPAAPPATASALANAMAEFESLTRSAQQKAAPASFAAPTPFEAPAPASVPAPAPAPAPFAAPASAAFATPDESTQSTADRIPTADGLSALFGQPDPEPARPAPVDEPPAFDFLLKPSEPAAAPTPLPEQAPTQQLPAQPHPFAAPAPTPVPPPTAVPPQFQAPLPPPAQAPVDELTPQFVSPELTPTGQSYATSTGHWSNQAELDDESQDFENTLSRDLGRANPTTNALVLPITSQHTDFAASLNATGEILATGSINLPDGFGSRGGDSRRYDDPDVDHLFDAFDNEIISTDSAPVRAIRSVSTQTATRGVIHSNKPNGNRMLTVLLVAGCVMAIAVGALLVAGIVFNVF